MAKKVSLAFQPDGRMLPLNKLLPLRRVAPSVRQSEKYQRIVASLREVGLIEPLIVFPSANGSEQWLILDGTLRHDALLALGETEAFCLISTDDETYTYNHKVSQVQPIQEHFMILKAIGEGVSEERIAKTLNIDVATIRRKRNLLDGICPEAVELLKNTRISAAALRELKRVISMRQIEMAELMNSSHNYRASFAKCLYAGSQPDEKLETEKPPDDHGFSPEDSARLQRELEHLAKDFKTVQETHGENVLNLVLAIAYLKRLLSSQRVVRHLTQHFPEIFAEFEKIIKSSDLKDGNQDQAAA